MSLCRLIQLSTVVFLLPCFGNIQAQVSSWSFQLEGDIASRGKTYHIVDLDFCSDFDLGRLRVVGTKPIAYVSAQYEEWRPDKDKLPDPVRGNEIYEDEYWLNPASSIVRQVMVERIALAKQRKFYGILFDNVDFTGRETGFDSSPEMVKEFVSFLIDETHKAGLKFALRGCSRYLDEFSNSADFFVTSDGIADDKLQQYAAISKPIFNFESRTPKKSADLYPNVYSLVKKGGRLNQKEEVLGSNSVPLLPLSEEPGSIVSWSIQYEGDIVPRGKDYHVVDLFEVSDEELALLKSQGTKPIAYFSSQFEDWRPDTKDFPKEDIGKNLDDWEGERWINPHSRPIRELMIKRIRKAKERGFYGIDVDNVDFYHFDTGFDNSTETVLEYIRFFIAEAKKNDLKFSLKNATDLAYQLRDEVDFYQNEEGIEYKELYKYIGVGKPVFNIEYQKPKPGIFFPGIYSIYKANYKMDAREVLIYPEAGEGTR
ncbi:MAG: endo alpha-1,4 polygalactosaminidase [Verrucomicrobiales bacterium]|nr:endo alpha-1,4 polygalactosaminidase [Verrucomicrobiales bacterium]